MIEGITVYNFYLEMLVALTLFVFRLPRREQFVWRLLGALALMCGLWYLVSFVIPEINVVWVVARHILLFAGFVVGILFCWDVDLDQAAFCGVAGHSVQHVICKINVVLRIVIAMYFKVDVLWTYFIVTPVLYGLIWLAWGRDAMNGSVSMHFKSISQIVLVSVLLFCTAYVSQVFDYSFCDGNMRIFLAIVVLDILLATVILVVQFHKYVLEELRTDMTEIKRMHRFERQQMEQTKELMDLINIKSHDLKHQLLRVRGRIDEEEASELLKTISIYDSIVNTGNDSLNVVLAQKNLAVQKDGVVFTPMIDASSLGFMSEGDIYSLFGNILDNALEAVQKLPEDRRTITLVVKNITGFVSIHCENEYDGELEFRGNLPQTIKKDKSEHGFGLKSIAMLVKKYSGIMQITTEDNIFVLDILIPIKSK